MITVISAASPGGQQDRRQAERGDDAHGGLERAGRQQPEQDRSRQHTDQPGWVTTLTNESAATPPAAGHGQASGVVTATIAAARLAYAPYCQLMLGHRDQDELSR